eukprot:NODE_32_length_32166_cov_0.707737.p4 type:complete len:288 gc:universal NODE_32_length_32166_cov_0.707737:22583-23446(+)
MMKLSKPEISPIMEILKKELIELGYVESDIDNFIADLTKHKVSEDDNSSLFKMIRGKKGDSSATKEFEQRMQTITSELSAQGANTPQLLLELVGLSLDFSSLHRRNVKLIQDLDFKEQEKDQWRQLAEQRGISLFKLISSVCISDVLSRLPGQLQDHFKLNFGTQAQWDAIYTQLNLDMAILTFDLFQSGNYSNIGADTLSLFKAFDSFCKSKGISLEKNMLKGLQIKKERNIVMLHVKFTGQETDATDIIKACHVFGDYSALLDKEQTALINDLWSIAKVLGVYNK